MLRVFVAADITDRELAKKLVEVQSILASTAADLKLVEAQNLHFTLKFLGEISDHVVQEVSGHLDRIVLDSFNMIFRGMGVFPNRSHISVVWVGLDGDSGESLKKLASLVEDNLRYLQIGDTRPFHPHLTLARVRSGRNRERLLEVVDSMVQQELGSETLTKISLKKSTLTPAGPIYTDIHTVNLGGASR